MGGNSKNAQRTKNNARPSSSGRSAELLGTAVQPFVGFNTSDNLCSAGSSAGLGLPKEGSEVALSPEYNFIIKKICKKDSITKIKALQEFCDILADAENTDIKAVLPFWVKIYVNLAFSSDHKVRKNVQRAHAVLASKAGKQIAPHMKQLAPIWLASQYDSYTLAGTIATASFKTSFPESKLRKVFVFCKNEILNYVTKNITTSNASLAKQKGPKEYEKYIQLIVSSLKLYTLYLQNMPEASITVDKEINENLITNQEYLDLTKHSSSLIRSAWYECLYYLLVNATYLVEKNKSQIVSLVFSNIDDKDHITLPYIWNCLIIVQSTFDDWHTIIDFRQTSEQKLLSLIQNGAYDKATEIFPNFLPFLSNLSEKALRDSTFNFYEKFFNSFTYWFLNKAKSSSKNNFNAVANAFYECLRYVFYMKNKEEYLDVRDTCEIFLNRYILDNIYFCLTTENLPYKIVFENVADLVRNCTKNIETKLNQDMLKIFWNNLSDWINQNENDPTHVTKLTDLLIILYATKKTTKVRFADDKQSVLSKTKTFAIFCPSELKELALKTTRLCLEKISCDRNPEYINSFNELCNTFGDVEFFSRLSDDGTLQSTISHVTTKVLSIDGIQTVSLVETVFGMLKFLNDEEKSNYIEYLLVNSTQSAQFWFLRLSLSHPACMESAVRNSLRRQKVSEIILSVTKNALTENSTEKLNLIKMCFFENSAGEIPIDKTTMEGIINEISQPVCNPETARMVDECGIFLSQIMSVISSNINFEDLARNIFLKLFKLSTCNLDENILSEDTLWEVTTCWQDSILSDDVKMDQNVLEECTRIIFGALSRDNITIEEIEKIAKISQKLVCCLNDAANDNETVKNACDLIKVLLCSKQEVHVSVVTSSGSLYNLTKCIRGELVVNDITDRIEDIDLIQVEKLLLRQVFNIFVISKILVGEKDDTETEKENFCEDDAETEEENDCEDDAETEKENFCGGAGSFRKKFILSNHCLDFIYDEFCKAMQITAIFYNLEFSTAISNGVSLAVNSLNSKIKEVISNLSQLHINQIVSKVFEKLKSGSVAAECVVLNLSSAEEFQQGDSIPMELLNACARFTFENDANQSYVNVLQSFSLKYGPEALAGRVPFLQSDDGIRMFEMRCLLKNNFGANVNKLSDSDTVQMCLDIINYFNSKPERKQNHLLYNCDISEEEFPKIMVVAEFINLLTVAVESLSSCLTVSEWDLIRLALSSWVLSISKSLDHFKNSKVSIFIASVCRLFQAISTFVKAEKAKSSTALLLTVIEEWENVFALEVNLILMKSYYTLVSLNDSSPTSRLLLSEISHLVENLDYKLIFNSSKKGFQLKSDDIILFAISNLSNTTCKKLRTASLAMIKEMSATLVNNDLEILRKRGEMEERKNCNFEDDEWHLLHKFQPFLISYNTVVQKYLNEFSFKLTEIPNLERVDQDETLPFLYLWHSIIFICSTSPVELRSIYASWISEQCFHETILHLLFRLMPTEILRNYDSKIMNNDVFKPMVQEKLKDFYVSSERYSCYLYTEMLRHLPAVVRKWWSASFPRQKTFVDKLTTNFVSGLICQKELGAISNKKSQHDNMTISVHTSTREVTATYAIDEARMELVISLAPNHPLGCVKVESGKQIGGRLQSRVVVMQLTIFLMHQNGSILDGLSLWRKNLDKKFEGVEECYVCYSVIHQDTCQLPKLSCKTCRKRFHGPCLYKWFTTSSKSSCPICRNVF